MRSVRLHTEFVPIMHVAGSRAKCVKVVNCKALELDHGDYKKHPEVYRFIDRHLAGKRPEQFHTL